MKNKFCSYYLDSPLVTGRVFDVFKPEKITKEISIFIVHGGGWRGGSRSAFHPIMEAFNNEGYLVASTDYRLYAKDAFEQLSDIRAAYDRFVSILKEKNLPLKIAVYGESAGAHLASLLMCAEPGECGEENSLTNEWVKPSFGILQSVPPQFLPWEDMMPRLWQTMQNIAGTPYEKDTSPYERLSLINHIRKTNPPIFFMDAGLEHMFALGKTPKIVKEHRSMGINSQRKVYENAEHGFFYELKRNCQKEAFKDICLFLDGKLETEVE